MSNEALQSSIIAGKSQAAMCFVTNILESSVKKHSKESIKITTGNNLNKPTKQYLKCSSYSPLHMAIGKILARLLAGTPVSATLVAQPNIAGLSLSLRAGHPLPVLTKAGCWGWDDKPLDLCGEKNGLVTTLPQDWEREL